jgi:hypothetical protein
LSEREGEAIKTRPRCFILELGFGCGDCMPYFSTPLSDFADADGSPCYIADKYVGLTLDPKQHGLAIRRIQGIRPPVSDKFNVTLMCEDAARPSIWSTNPRLQLRYPITRAPAVPVSLRNVAAGQRGRYNNRNIKIHTSQRTYATLPQTNYPATGNDAATEKRVLALDCLYHFYPSREELFRYSN